MYHNNDNIELSPASVNPMHPAHLSDKNEINMAPKSSTLHETRLHAQNNNIKPISPVSVNPMHPAHLSDENETYGPTNLMRDADSVTSFPSQSNDKPYSSTWNFYASYVANVMHNTHEGMNGAYNLVSVNQILHANSREAKEAYGSANLMQDTKNSTSISSSSNNLCRAPKSPINHMARTYNKNNDIKPASPASVNPMHLEHSRDESKTYRSTNLMLDIENGTSRPSSNDESSSSAWSISHTTYYAAAKKNMAGTISYASKGMNSVYNNKLFSVSGDQMHDKNPRHEKQTYRPTHLMQDTKNTTSRPSSSNNSSSSSTWRVYGAARKNVTGRMNNGGNAMSYAHRRLSGAYDNTQRNVANSVNAHRAICAELTRGCLILTGAAAVTAALGIVLITSFTVAASHAWIYNDTKQFIYVAMYGPNFGTYATHVTPSILFPYADLNVTLNGYNSYADIFLSNNCQIHISQHGQKAKLKHCPNNWEIVKQTPFIYFFSSHFTLKRKSGSPNNYNASTEISGMDFHITENNVLERDQIIDTNYYINDIADIHLASKASKLQLVQVALNSSNSDEDKLSLRREFSFKSNQQTFYTKVIQSIENAPSKIDRNASTISI